MSNIKANFSYNLVYQLFTIIMPLITAPYISRVLGVDGVGTYSYYYSVAAYFVYFELLGVNNYGVRCIAKCKDEFERSQVFINIYAVQFICSLIVCFVYINYIFFFSNNKLISLVLLLYVLSGALDINWFFFGTEQFKITTKRNCLIKLGTIAFIFILVKTRNDVYIYTAIMSAGYLFSQLIMWMYAIRQLRFCKPNVKELPGIFRSLLILFIPVIAVSIYKMMDKIMLGKMTSMIEVGYYESAEKIVGVPSVITVALGTSMLPRMSSLNSKNESETFNNYFVRSIDFVSLIGIPIVFGLIAIADLFIPLYYGNEFYGSITIMKVLSLSLVFSTWASVIRTQYLIPKERDKSYVASVLTGAAVNFIVNVTMIPQLGGTGAAIGTVCAEAIVAIFQAVQIQREVRIWKYLALSTKYFFPGLLMYIVVRKFIALDILPAIINVIVAVLIACVTYFSLLIISYICKRKLHRMMH